MVGAATLFCYSLRICVTSTFSARERDIFTCKLSLLLYSERKHFQSFASRSGNATRIVSAAIPHRHLYQISHYHLFTILFLLIPFPLTYTDFGIYTTNFTCVLFFLLLRYYSFFFLVIVDLFAIPALEISEAAITLLR